MSQLVTKSTATKLVAILTDSEGIPVTNVAYSAVTVRYKKSNSSTFTVKTILNADFTNNGEGVYEIQFTSSELDTLGSFVFTVAGSGFVQYTGLVNVVPESSDVSPAISTIPLCTLYGYIANPDGTPAENVTVILRVINMPYQYNSILYTNKSISTKTDGNGFWSIDTVRMAFVSITISSSGMSRTLTIPNQSSADFNKIA